LSSGFSILFSSNSAIILATSSSTDTIGLYEKVFKIIGKEDREEAEEFLAEEFAKYKLGLPIDKKLEIYFKREQNVFRSILNFLRNFFGIGRYNILNQFKELDLVLLNV
jgi:hypothetical protein